MTVSKLYIAVLDVIASKRGAAMVEYALLAALIAIIAMTAVGGLGTGISNKFTSITNSL